MHRPGEVRTEMTDETPDRASSPELTSTSVDAPADGMARKTTHERYLGRRRSSQSDELPTNGGQARTPSDRVVDGVPQTGPNRSEIASFFVILSGTIGVWRVECCLRHIGRWQAGRGVD